MDCPKCGNELPAIIFGPESFDVAAEFNRCPTCPKCGLRITKDLMWDNMKPTDCKKVQNEEICEDEFDPYDDGFCIDCIEDCIFARGDET